MSISNVPLCVQAAKIEYIVPMDERLVISDLNQLRVFAEVARHASVTAAAHRLGKPKSTVSRDVARLERSLGAVLFSRNGRRLVLTEAGALFADYAARILATIDEASDAVAADVGTARGVLTVQATYWVGNALIVPKLPSFIRSFPNVNVVLELRDFSNLSTHNWDIQVTAGNLVDSSHSALRITDIVLRMYASEGYISRHGSPTELADLVAHTVVDKHWTAGTSPWLNDSGVPLIAVTPRLVVNDMIAIATAVKEGVGIGWLPTFLANGALEDGPLIPILPTLRPVPIPVYALFPRRRTVSPKVRAFVDHLASAFRSTL